EPADRVRDLQRGVNQFAWFPALHQLRGRDGEGHRHGRHEAFDVLVLDRDLLLVRLDRKHLSAKGIRTRRPGPLTGGGDEDADGGRDGDELADYSTIHPSLS